MKGRAPWILQVKGDPDSELWEISVVHEGNIHGRESWGWFDNDKLLISHNGGSCRWALAPGLGSVMVEIGSRLCDFLNRGDNINEFFKLGGS
jgi:hypothetical protein